MKNGFLQKMKSGLFAILIGVLGMSVSDTQAQMTLQIGSGGSTSSYFPIYSCYSYNYSQMIYTDTMMYDAGATAGVDGYIYRVAFKVGSTALSNGNFKDWTVYMANTSVTHFTAMSDYIALADLTEVYDGVIPTLEGGEWIWLTLSTPFTWDGTSNIVVAIHENTPNYSCTQSWAAFNSGKTRGILWYQDGGDISLSSPSATYTYGPNSYIAQIRFSYLPDIPCDDVDFAVGTLTGLETCPNNAFTVENSGSMLAMGVTRTWQQRVPSGTGTWTTIAGAEATDYFNPDGITEDTDYRCIVICEASGEEDTTNEVTVSVSDPSECYCIPSSTYSYSYTIDYVGTTMGVTNFSNATGDYITSIGYSDYTDDYSVSQYQGESVSFTASANSMSTNLAVWVDWNQDGIFSDDEQVYLYLTSSGAGDFGGSFTVPIDAVPGNTRMRVRSSYYYYSYYTDGGIDPCMNIYYGEAEDYTFTVIETPNCAEIDIDAGTLEDFSICPSVDFWVYNTGTTVATGTERIWQSSPAGAGTWTTITGEEGTHLFVDGGITDPTDFRCILICTETGESDTTNICAVTMNEFWDCYCIPSATYSGSYVINQVETSFGVTNFSNSSYDYTTSIGYSDYTDGYSVSQYQGESVSFYAKVNNGYANFGVWVDWNQNGVFEDDEQVYDYFTSTGYPGPTEYEGSFNVPVDAIPGNTRIRFRSAYYYYSWYTEGDMDPCWNVYYGEAEDYTFTVIETPHCTDIDIDAGDLDDMSVCPDQPFYIYNFTTTIAFGTERIWQSSPAGTGDWTTITGETATHLYVSAGISEATDYRCILICTETGESDTTNIASISLNPFFDCYCIPTSTYTYTDYTISSMETFDGVTNFSNTSGAGITSTGYSDYTDEYSVSQYQGQPVSFEATSPWGGSNFAIWVDWNQNGVFEEAEQVYLYFTSSGAGSFEGTFTVPLDAIPGDTRMRARSAYYYYSFYTDGAMDPCWNVMYGEAEDYTFTVIEATPCNDPEMEFPEVVNIGSTPEDVCGEGDITLSITTEMPIAAGVTYKWQSSSSATGPWTDISEPSLYDEYFHEDVSENTFFRCEIFCMGDHLMYTEVIEVESVIPVEPVLDEAQTCGPGSAILSGTTEAGSIYWFDSEVGGLPFATGDAVESPYIETTTTFYASSGAFPPSEIQIGDASSTIYYYNPGPFNTYYQRYTMQLMYKAGQLLDEGAMAGDIDAISFYMSNAPSVPLPDYTVSIKTVPASSMATLAWQTTGMTEVFGGTGFDYAPSGSGWQTMNFNTPINWDGNSHIIVQVCWSQNSGSAWGSTGMNRYTNTPGQMLYSGSNSSGSSCGETGYNSSTYLPNALFRFSGCVSDRVPVIAYVRDTPYVQIDVEDGTYCLFNNQYIIPTSPEQPAGTTLLWSTGDTEEDITVTGPVTSEMYWVEATNEWGCTNSDTVVLTLNPSPEVDLGPDVAVCEGSVVVLDAGDDGDSYYWNTSETTQIIEVNDGGDYIVLVTNSYDCMSSDTIHVTVEGFAPSIDGIIVDNLSPTTFLFTPLHPENIIEYSWSFGDGATSSSESPTHEYDEPGTYMVTLTVTSTCGENIYYTYATIVQGIDEYELSKNNLKLYPNPTDNLITVETIGDVKMDQIKVINMLGQEIMTQDLDHQSSVILDVSRLASGMYHVQIQSNKGTLVKKFQVVR